MQKQRHRTDSVVGRAAGLIVGLMAVALVTMVGCDSHRTIDTGDDHEARPSAQAKQPAGGTKRGGEALETNAAAGGAQGGAARPSMAQDDRYRIRTYPRKVEAGSTTRVHFDIVAGDGWKANRDFNQWSFLFEPTDATNLKRTEFGTSEVDVTEARARATTAVTIPGSVEPGTSVDVRAVATFSVCTDETCHVMRDEALAFPLQVVETREPPPGGSGPRPFR